MGQIARRRKKSQSRISFPWRNWLTRHLPTARNTRAGEDAMPNDSQAPQRPTSWLSRIWHLPEQLTWMEPLPVPHRRGIIAAILVILVAFLWPSATQQQPPSGEKTISLETSGTESPLQAEITDHVPGNVSQGQSDNQGSWQTYSIAEGQTLAQLFRDNNLPVNDVFAMAQSEGSDKPLSTVHAGQKVRIRQNSTGVVTGLTLETDNGEILFTRQTDGSFIRAQ